MICSTRCWLIGMVLVALAAPAGADDDDWVGRRVMLKENAQPMMGTRQLSWSAVPLPATVGGKNGSWLYVGSAWVQRDQLVLIEDAPAYYTTLIQRGSSVTAAYALRGVSWFTLGEHENAVRDLSEALRREPGNSNFACVRGKAYYMQHKYDLAMADFTEAIRLDPNNAVAYNDRGATFNAESEYAKAKEQFDLVLRRFPDNALAFANRGANWADQNEFDKALEDINQAIKLDPKFAGAYVNRGKVLFKKGDYPQAIADYETAVKLAPHSWEGYYGWAGILATSPWPQIRSGRRAVEMATKACELSRWNEWLAVQALAAAYAETGDFEAAVKWQTKAIALSQPAEEKDQKENEQRLALYQAGKPYYVTPLTLDPLAEGKP